MAEIINTASEADLLATDEMIRNLRAGRLRNIAIGIGAAGCLLLIGVSSIVWAARQGNDPDAIKEALKNLPPLAITVKIDPESKIAIAEGGKVELADGGTVALEPGARVTVRGTVKSEATPTLPKTKPAENPAIKTTVVVFTEVKHSEGKVITGWKFANGAAKVPFEQYCYYNNAPVNGVATHQNVAQDRELQMTAGVSADEQARRFDKCHWFDGGGI